MLFFSVIVPNYNHATYLHQRIESIIQQTYQNFELIILDDASQDNSKEVIESYRNHPLVAHIVYNSKNSGSPFKQWKKGIELASGQWIWIAESDDYADKKFLSNAVASIQLYPSTGLYYCDAFIEEGLQTGTKKVSTKKNFFFNTAKWSDDYFIGGLDEINENLKLVCTINNASSTVFKKEFALLSLNGLEHYTFHGDWLFYLRICSITDVYYSRLPLNSFRQHQKSHLAMSGFTILKKQEYFEILKFLYDHSGVTEKRKLIYHFCTYYLNFGIIHDGLTSGFSLIRNYFQKDADLAGKVILDIIHIKISRKKYKGWFE